MLARASRASARSTCLKCIVRHGTNPPWWTRRAPGFAAPVIASLVKMFQATTRRNRKVFGRRSHPAAKRAGTERKNKIETRSADVRSDLEWRPPIADDREWNHAFRHRLEGRQAKLDQFANAQACA